MKKTDENNGIFFVILAGICWGIISVFINRLTGRDYNSLQICFIRTVFSVLMLAVFFLFYDRTLFKIELKDCWMFIGTGILSLTFFSFCYFSTIVSSGAAVAVVLLYTSPVFVMLMSALIFKEKITGRKILGLLLTVGGCIFVAGLLGSGAAIAPIAFITGLGAGFGYALYSIFANFATKKYSPLTITFYTFVFSGISLIFLANPNAVFNNFKVSDLPWFLGISFICTVVPYITYTIGLSKMDPGRAAVLVTVEPLVGCIFGLCVWKEQFTLFKLAGIIMIFAAIVIFAVKEKDN